MGGGGDGGGVGMINSPGRERMKVGNPGLVATVEEAGREGWRKREVDYKYTARDGGWEHLQ